MVSLAVESTLSKYGANVPDSILILLWIVPVIPLGYWLWTHEKLVRHRNWWREAFRNSPFSTAFSAVAALLILAGCLYGAGRLVWRGALRPPPKQTAASTDTTPPQERAEPQPSNPPAPKSIVKKSKRKEPESSVPTQSAPNGINIGRDNNGSAVVNNYGNLPDVPDVGTVPTITVCYSQNEVSGGNNYFPGDSFVTTIALQTDTPITRPAFGFLFDGPVGAGKGEISGISTTAFLNNLSLVGYEERSYVIKLISVDFPNGGDRWIPGVTLKATVPSTKKVKLEAFVSFFGKEQRSITEHLKYICDTP